MRKFTIGILMKNFTDVFFSSKFFKSTIILFMFFVSLYVNKEHFDFAEENFYNLNILLMQKSFVLPEEAFFVWLFHCYGLVFLMGSFRVCFLNFRHCFLVIT